MRSWLLIPVLLTSPIAGGLTGCSSSTDDTGDDPDAESPTPTPTAAPDTADCSVDRDGWTVGLLCSTAEASDGYVLFAPLRSNSTYLIDRDGREVHSWKSSYLPGQSAYLLENGHLLRTAMTGNDNFQAGAAAGRLQDFDWDGNLVWDWTYSSDTYLTHHDVKALPDGNVLVLAWEVKSGDEAIAAGRDPSLLTDGALWGEHILEVKPTGATTGEIVWEWHVWDHLVQDFDSDKGNYGVVGDHPELLDVNYIGDSGGNPTGADWLHLNAIDYNVELDQIIISSRFMSEVYVIDHSTATGEAASHSGGRYGKGGDILYRWGNPQVYRAGSAEDRIFYGQHSAHWIDAELPGGGDILVFNNGLTRPDGQYSTVDELAPSVADDSSYQRSASTAFGPQGLVWQYKDETPSDLYADRVSGAHRIENGSTLVAEGTSGTIFEVTADGAVVWKYVVPVVGDDVVSQGETVQGQSNSVFRAYRYAPDYAGLEGKDLTPGDFLEDPAQ